MAGDKEFLDRLEAQGVSREYARRAYYYLKRIGVEPDTVDIAAEYDGNLTTGENMAELKRKYVNVGTPDRGYSAAEMDSMATEQDRQLLEQRRHGGYTPRHKELPGAKAYRKRKVSVGEDELPPASVAAPSLLDRLTGKAKELESKYITEPARRRDKERYYKAEQKIRERQERIKVKQAEREERELARQEKELNREAFLASPAGRAIEGGKQALTGFRGVARGFRGNHSAPGSYSPQFADSGNLRNMLAPKMNYGGQSSPLMGNQGGGNSVILGLLTGRKSNRPRGHYVTVIDRGVAKRVYTGQPQPGQPPPQQPQNPLLQLETRPPQFDYSVSGNSIRDRLALGNARYGYSLKPNKKMRYL